MPTLGEPSRTLAVMVCRMFVIETDADARLMASLHATDQNELLFTTYSFTHNSEYNKEAIHPARHLWQNLREIDRLNNTIIITYDLHTCQVLTEHGIPCFLDRWSRQPGDLPGAISLCRAAARRPPQTPLSCRD